MKEEIEVYSIRGALTNGRIARVTARPDQDGAYVWVAAGLRKLGRDAFLSEIDACGAARAKRDKKIAALEKQIAKLRNMEF